MQDALVHLMGYHVCLGVVIFHINLKINNLWKENMLAEKVRVSTMSVILTVLLKLSYPTFFVNRTSNHTLKEGTCGCFKRFRSCPSAWREPCQVSRHEGFSLKQPSSNVGRLRIQSRNSSRSAWESREQVKL